MNDSDPPSNTTPHRRRPAWNKGKMPGPKPPLRPGHVWAIRAKLQLEKRTRDLAMFNLAIDSKLRGCDLVALRVDDVAPNGHAIDRANIRQRKTGWPVRFELTEVARQALDDYLRASFTRCCCWGRSLNPPCISALAFRLSRTLSKLIKTLATARGDSPRRDGAAA